MQYLRLSRGKYAAVNDDVYQWARNWKWHAMSGRGGLLYAVRAVHIPNTRRHKTVVLHRAIMEHAGYDLNGMVVDHIDGDGLNNVDANLRVATISQNGANRRGLDAKNTSGFRGVSFNRQYNKWVAQIKVGDHRPYLGRFDTAEQAARARDAYILAHGLEEFYPLNFPELVAA